MKTFVRYHYTSGFAWFRDGDVFYPSDLKVAGVVIGGTCYIPAKWALPGVATVRCSMDNVDGIRPTVHAREGGKMLAVVQLFDENGYNLIGRSRKDAFRMSQVVIEALVFEDGTKVLLNDMAQVTDELPAPQVYDVDPAMLVGQDNEV